MNCIVFKVLLSCVPSNHCNMSFFIFKVDLTCKMFCFKCFLTSLLIFYLSVSLFCKISLFLVIISQRMWSTDCNISRHKQIVSPQMFKRWKDFPNLLRPVIIAVMLLWVKVFFVTYCEHRVNITFLPLFFQNCGFFLYIAPQRTIRYLVVHVEIWAVFHLFF